MHEAELVFSQVLNCDRLSLYLNRSFCLDKDKSALIAAVLERRISGEPIQYILGKTEFMGLDFKLNKDVFIPRPETENLVERAIKAVAGKKVLDLGTGSGCIAVSLGKLMPEVEITASDISEKALSIAKINAKLNNVKINLILGDLFNTYNLQLDTYDLIVSNPPYIPTDEIDKLQPEIGYEPRVALDGGRDGLDFYRGIIRQAPPYLKEGGFLIMEMGFNQAEEIKNIFQNSGNFKILEIIKDYHGIERIAVAQKR